MGRGMEGGLGGCKGRRTTWGGEGGWWELESTGLSPQGVPDVLPPLCSPCYSDTHPIPHHHPDPGDPHLSPASEQRLLSACWLSLDFTCTSHHTLYFSRFSFSSNVMIYFYQFYFLMIYVGLILLFWYHLGFLKLIYFIYLLFYSRSLLVICFKYSSVYMSIPTSASIPPLTLPPW